MDTPGQVDAFEVQTLQRVCETAQVKGVFTKTPKSFNKGGRAAAVLIVLRVSERFETLSGCPSLIWLPLSFFILSFLPYAHPSSPIPPSLPPPPLSLIQTYWVRMLSASSLNVLPHRFHRPLTHRLSARLLACQFLCSSYFCVTAGKHNHSKVARE